MEKDIEARTEKDSSYSPDRYGGKDVGTIEEPKHGNFMGRFIDSFKRNPNARVTTEMVDEEGKPIESAEPAEPALAMKLKNRHLQMIAIGMSSPPGSEIGWKYSTFTPPPAHFWTPPSTNQS